MQRDFELMLQNVHFKLYKMYAPFLNQKFIFFVFVSDPELCVRDRVWREQQAGHHGGEADLPGGEAVQHTAVTGAIARHAHQVSLLTIFMIVFIITIFILVLIITIFLILFIHHLYDIIVIIIFLEVFSIIL